MNKFNYNFTSNSFFSVVDELLLEFSSDTSREQIFNHCVEERLSAVLEVQSRYFDEELENLERTLNWDLSDISNIRNISKVLKNLYKIIACDRISIISSLISIYEV